MKQHLIDLFGYTDWANRRLLEVIKQLPDQEEAVRLFSHLITSQDKWLNRITREADDQALSWSGPVFPVDGLEQKWADSYRKWADLLEAKDEPALGGDVVFTRASDGKAMKVKLRDIVLQLNYHAIHHRAQINRLISRQGFAPPPTDYILTAIRET